MSPENRPFDWARFLVQFFFGALFGALAGLYLAAGASGQNQAILIVVGMALVAGLIAGFLGDRFWQSFRDGSLWNPFRWF